MANKSSDRARVVVGQDGYVHRWPQRLHDADRKRLKLEVDFEDWIVRTAGEFMPDHEFENAWGVGGHLRMVRAMVDCMPEELYIPPRMLSALRDIIYVRWATSEWHSNLPVSSSSLTAQKTAGHKHFVKVLRTELMLFKEYQANERAWLRRTGQA